MSIHFDDTRWQQVRENYTAWWNGTLGRPLCKVTVKGAYAPPCPKPAAPLLSQQNCHDLSIPAEALVDALDWELSQQAYLGDAFPFVNMAAFGPASLAGFCGAKLDNSTGSVWYFPARPLPIEQLSIRYDPDSVWAARIKEIYRAGQRRWGNQVLFSMPDLGGFQDVLAVFAGSEELMVALLEEPEEVERLQGEVYRAFWEAYNDFASVLQPQNPGYSHWGGLYSSNPSYILQDDFAYMISPAHFRTFALPDIARAAETLDNSIYHLDGVGNLNHLDMLLACPDIGAVQWVPGAGQPGPLEWLEVYDRIAAAGKKIEIIGPAEDFSKLCQRYGHRLFYHLLVDDPQGGARKAIDYKDCLNDYHIIPANCYETLRPLLETATGMVLEDF